MNSYFLSLKEETPKRGYWDYGFLERILSGEYPTSNFVETEFREVNRLPRDDRAFVIVPARHHAGLEERIKDELNKIKHPVLFLMGDEEADFKVEAMPDIPIWVQNPHPTRHDKYFKLGTGIPQHFRPKWVKKDKVLFFSGQVTHNRRRELMKNLTELELSQDIEVNYTKSFTAGFEPDVYIEKMSRAKIVPCPSGAVIPDSFRAFEALESMAIPILDEVNPSGSIQTYWDWLLGENPLPKVTNWDRLVGLVEELLKDYPMNVNEIMGWWSQYKRNTTYEIFRCLQS